MCETNARLKKVEEDIDLLKQTLVRSGTSDLAGPSFPIFSDPAEYEAAGNDPGKLVSVVNVFLSIMFSISVKADRIHCCAVNLKTAGDNDIMPTCSLQD